MQSELSTKAKTEQLRFLSQSVRLEESVNPRIVSMTSWTCCLSVAAFLLWASIVNINEVARAPGEVIPQGLTQSVQHLEGGLVTEIKVSEGQTVSKDQVLMILDGAGTQQDKDRANSENVFLSMQKERLKAFIEAREPDFSAWEKSHQNLVRDQKKIFDSMMDARSEERSILTEQIAQKKQGVSILNSRADIAQKNYALTQDMYDRRQGLYRQGYISHMNFMESEQRLNEARGERSMVASEIKQVKSEIAEYENRLKSLDASQYDRAWQELNQIEAQLAQNNQVLEKMDNRIDRLEVRSPVHGMIKSLSVNTIGAVVQPGQNLSEIVPVDRQLLVEVRIPPHHIGHLKTGQDVQVKVSTFDFARYGSIPGRLDFISPTTFAGERGERFYKGRIILDRNYAGSDPGKNIITPGMTVMADMVTGNKTVMAYLLKPIHSSIQTAFTER